MKADDETASAPNAEGRGVISSGPTQSAVALAESMRSGIPLYRASTMKAFLFCFAHKSLASLWTICAAHPASAHDTKHDKHVLSIFPMFPTGMRQ
jgi:hypothetical protein